MIKSVRPLALCLLAAAALLPTPARAHFILDAPACYSQQNFLGDPQKLGPCGGNVMETGAVTTYRPGQMVTVTVREVIPHPGHYRVALAADTASLPPDPAITKVGADDCGSAAIQSNPTLPVLADNMLPHSQPFPKDGMGNALPQSFQVKLPDNFTCDRCKLQVLEYMREHGAPCFYYHCATISIQEGGAGDGPAPADMATVPASDLRAAGDMATTMPPGGGCSCNVASGRGAADLSFLLILGLLIRRRR